MADKNIHPDANKAFEAVSQAYETLSNQESRTEYDNKCLSRYQANKWTMSKMYQFGKNYIHNAYSNLVFIASKIISYSREKGIYVIAVYIMKSALSSFVKIVSKIRYQCDTLYMRLKLAPSWTDRYLIVSEMIVDEWRRFLLWIFLILCIF